MVVGVGVAVGVGVKLGLKDGNMKYTPTTSSNTITMPATVKTDFETVSLHFTRAQKNLSEMQSHLNQLSQQKLVRDCGGIYSLWPCDVTFQRLMLEKMKNETSQESRQRNYIALERLSGSLGKR